jgi:hypothetical protein
MLEFDLAHNGAFAAADAQIVMLFTPEGARSRRSLMSTCGCIAVVVEWVQHRGRGIVTQLEAAARLIESRKERSGIIEHCIIAGQVCHS